MIMTSKLLRNTVTVRRANTPALRLIANVFLMLSGAWLGLVPFTVTAQDINPQAASPSSQSSGPPTSSAVMGNDLIYPEDVLDVYVYDVPELSREYAVNGTGTITVPLLPKPVRAAGLTPDQLARSLEESFRQSGRLSHAQITIYVKQSRRSIVTVEGAVRTPQSVLVVGPTSLLSVISQCGGRSDDAGNTITITRGEQALHDLSASGKDPTQTVKIGFKELLDPNDPTAKVKVWPGDRVSVDRAGIFYVLGQVGRPGGYNLKSADEQVSVLQALALAGDVTPIAKTDKAMIIRKDAKASDGRQEIALNLKNILHGSSPDRVLQADDILYIPASGGKKAMRTATGLGVGVIGAASTAAVYTRF